MMKKILMGLAGMGCLALIIAGCGSVPVLVTW